MMRRFDYVWQHFCSVYQVPAGLRIAYGDNKVGQVKIAAYQGGFFEGQHPWPQDICWQQWQGQQLPFLFSPQDNAPIITQQNQLITIRHDLIAAAFYFLSGWQEYHAPDRDRYGRFPYQSSLQFKLGIITLPVVNYYFDILKTAIEQALHTKLPFRLNPEAGLTAFLTHDIDNSQSGWKSEGRQALQQGRPGRFLHLLLARLRGQDAWFNWPGIARQVCQAGGRSTFFFLSENRPYRGINNADYAIEKPRYQQALQELRAAGAEIALHGSLQAAFDRDKLMQEKKKLPFPIMGNRFHFLRFDPRLSPGLLDDAGIAYDSTLGFAEHFGFRHSYCFPFRLFNFKTRQAYRFLEIPLIVMDTTLHHPRYLQLEAAAVLPALKPVLDQVQKFKGCFTLLWHNENFSPAKTHNGPHVFWQLYQELHRRRAALLQGSDIEKHFAACLLLS